MNAFTYNPCSEVLTAQFGTNGTDYIYDDIGNHSLYPANNLNQYLDSGIEYDSDGNMTRHGDMDFTWDAENRMVSADNGVANIVNSYDYKHRRIKKMIGDSVHSFVYDGGNLIGETVDGDAVRHYFWGLDLSDSLQGAGGVGGLLTCERQSGTLLERGYGVESRTESLNMPGYAVTNLYDGFGRRCGVTARIGGASLAMERDYSEIDGCPSAERIAGMERVFTYEATRDLLCKVENPCSRWEYEYDAAGRRSRRIDDGTFTNVFLHNPRSEIVWADQNGSVEAYSYDEIGNRTGLQANGLNQYAFSGFAYDEDGNMLSDGNRNYVWDGENRLSEIVPTLATNGSWKVRMRYDHLGRMVVMERSAFFGDWIDEKRTRLVWDGWNPIAEIEADLQTGQTNSSYYLWGPDISVSGQEAGGIGGLLAVVRNGQAYVPWYDGNGNVTEYTDTNGVVVARYRYDPFGIILESSGSRADEFRFRFSTKYHEPVSGLVLYQKRAYCPELGRWLNRDPVGENGGLNLYAFCGNNPVDNFDVLGLTAGISATKNLVLGNCGGMELMSRLNVPAGLKGSILQNMILEVNIFDCKTKKNITRDFFDRPVEKYAELIVEDDKWIMPSVIKEGGCGTYGVASWKGVASFHQNYYYPTESSKKDPWGIPWSVGFGGGKGVQPWGDLYGVSRMVTPPNFEPVIVGLFRSLKVEWNCCNGVSKTKVMDYQQYPTYNLVP